MARKHVLAVLGAALALGATVFATTAASQQTRPVADDPNNANLTYWYWGEDDAPGANAWLKKEVAAYEKAHPKVKIKVVMQSTDTLTSAFTTAAQTKSGPDIATQWATLPVLTPAWNGASVPISDYVPASETKNWIGTAENMSGGKLWAMPQYLLGIPFVWNKAMFKKAGLDPNKGPKTWAEFLADAKKLKAAGFTPFGMGNKDGYGGAWFFSLIGKQNLNSIDELKAAMIGKAKFSDPKYSGFYQALADLKKNGYLNSDVASITLHAGPAALRPEEGRDVLGHRRQRRGRGQGARRREGHGRRRRSRSGARASSRRSYDTTQSSSAFITKWSKHPAGGGAVPDVPAHAAGAQGLVQGDRRVPGRQALPGLARDRSDREEAAQARPVRRLGLARELRAAASRRQRRSRRR